MTVLESVYDVLRSCELAKNQYEFSVAWCGMSKGYLSWIKSSKAEPSIEALSKLLFRVERAADRLADNKEYAFPEVLELDANALRQVSRSVKSELERACL